MGALAGHRGERPVAEDGWFRQIDVVDDRAGIGIADEIERRTRVPRARKHLTKRKRARFRQV